MSLTSSLARRNHVWEALVREAPLLASPTLLADLNVDHLLRLPDLTTPVLSSTEAALVGTAFDYLQRYVVGDRWRREPRWQTRHVNRWPLLAQLHPWAVGEAEVEQAALTMALLDQMGRVGVGKVVGSPAHRAIFKATTVEDYVKALPAAALLALRELRALNTPIMEEYRTRSPLVPGPHLFSSAIAHGADPDAIYGRALVELKTHKKVTRANLTAALAQALAYALLDTVDEFELDAIEVWEAKQAQRVVVPLSLLVPDLPVARRRFGLTLRWTQHARDADHAQDLIDRGMSRVYGESQA